MSAPIVDPCEPAMNGQPSFHQKKPIASSCLSNVIQDESKQRQQDITNAYITNALTNGSALFNRTFKKRVRSKTGQKRVHREVSGVPISQPIAKSVVMTAYRKRQATSIITPPILTINEDIMTCCMSYLTPEEVLSFLSQPLCKSFRETYSTSESLWQVLCLSGPFYAKEQCSNAHYISLGRYRMLYASLVQCMKCLEQIQISTARNQEMMLSKVKGTAASDVASKQQSQSTSVDQIHFMNGARSEARRSSKNSDEVPEARESKKAKSSVKLASKLFDDTVATRNNIMNGSCAIFSIVNLLVAFSDIVGIKKMCLETLIPLLEDESQRITALQLGLTNLILEQMNLFPNEAELQIASLHTIVLLARPLGGKEGMLFFHATNNNTIHNFHEIQNGISIVLQSMKRFHSNAKLQAMGCWSLVNIALSASQRIEVLRSGGLQIVMDAMAEHSHIDQVQFRALFALINLVIPCSREDETTAQRQETETWIKAQKQIIDKHVSETIKLVINAMQNFKHNESILNRSCLVLNNLSLNENYRSWLLWAPGCYQILNWTRSVYIHNSVIQQSAGGTIHRLKEMLSKDENLCRRFVVFIRSQRMSTTLLEQQG